MNEEIYLHCITYTNKKFADFIQNFGDFQNLMKIEFGCSIYID